MVTRSGTDRSVATAHERQAAEMALQQKMEAERKKRHLEKQKRKEERQREEDERKRREDEERRNSATQKEADAPKNKQGVTVSPNDLEEMDIEPERPGLIKNLFGVMFGEEGESPSPTDRSPPKNKAKKNSGGTVSLTGDRASRGIASKNAIKSALKTSFKESHVHNHPRTLVEASIELRGETPMQEFVVSLQELLKNGQMVDKSFAYCPVKENSGAKLLHEAPHIPTNMTLLSCYFKMSNFKGRNPFEKQKVYKNNKEVKGELRNPMIYFSMAIASDEEPEELLSRVIHEWHRRGGVMLRIKELQTFESETILCLFNILTITNKKTILAEFSRILTQAQDLAQEADMTDFLWDPADLPRHSLIPALELRLQNPKTPGHDTSSYNKLSWRAQANRKVYHVECDRRHAQDIKRLTQLAKDNNLVTNMWGKHAHVSEVVDTDSTPSEIKRLARVAQVHCNYQCSMVLEDVSGITDLDGEATLTGPDVATPLRLSLRKLLLTNIRLSDGHQLLAEIHQADGVMGRVQAVIPNTPEAEQMILMMNRNFPAYVYHVLADQGLPKDFLMELFTRLCCPTLIAEMESCTWDPDTGTLTTPREATENKSLAELEQAPWFKDAFADIGRSSKAGPKPPPESMFNLDEDRSIKTIHHRNEANLLTRGNQPVSKKAASETVQLTSSDEESASSSSTDRSRSDATDGVEYSPTSSAEDIGVAPGATNGG